MRSASHLHRRRESPGCAVLSRRAVAGAIVVALALSLSSCSRSDPIAPPNPAALQKMAEATSARSAGDWGQAVALLRGAVEADSRSSEAALACAALLVELQLPIEAVVMYELASTRNPSDPRSFLRLAELYRATGRPAIALTSLEAAEKAAPGDSEVLVAVGRSRLDAGNMFGAAGVLGKAIAARPTDPEPLYLSARIERDRHAYGEAESMFRRALRLQPAHVATAVELAKMLTELGRPSEAIELLRQTRNAGATESPALYREMIAIQRKRGQDETVQKLLVAVQAIEARAARIAELSDQLWSRPSDSGLRRDLGLAFYEARRWHESEGALRGWLHLEPESSSDAWVAIARSCLQREDLVCVEGSVGRASAGVLADQEPLRELVAMLEARGHADWATALGGPVAEPPVP